jgi:hypothetical protein
MIKNLLNRIIRTKFTNLIKLNIRLSASNFLLKNTEYYKSFLDINDAGLKVYSQNNEDGIIHFLLKMLSVKNSKFVEIGTEPKYHESNTRFLYESTDSEGLIIDNFLDLKYLEEDHTQEEYEEKQKQLSKEFVREWLIANNFMGKEGQTVPAMSPEWIDTISKRYIELYEQVIGEKFKPQQLSEEETYQVVCASLEKLS